MIAKLKGIVDGVTEDSAVIDVGGVGYLVYCSARTLGRLGRGEPVALEIETHVREDHIHLYGFVDAVERDWFQLLTTVQGVGARVGLGILSALAPDQLTHAVVTGDKGAITQAPGVGPKLATRILSELKDRVGGVALASIAGPAAAGSLLEKSSVSEAASALVNLGYNSSEALGAVARAAANLGEDAEVEALIRGGLGELAPAEARG